METITNLEIFRNALKFICGESETICRLCLSSTAKNQINLEEIVNLKTVYHDESITYQDMLLEMGISVEEELPQVLCKDCVRTLKHSYLFQKLCQFSSKKWDETINRLNIGIREAENLHPNTQSLYFVINKKENLMFSSKKSHFDKSKSFSSNYKRNALAKIRTIVKSREYYFNYTKKQKETLETKHYSCDTCNMKFKSEHSMINHLKLHKERHVCNKCTKIFPTQKQVDEHKERVHRPRNIQCQKCGKMFSTQKILHMHNLLHHVAAVCKLCFAQFPSKYALKNHMDKHDLHKCPKCKKSYGNKNTYKAHLKICGDNDKQPSFFCDICGKGYVRKNGIRTHLKVDHGFGNILSCVWCDKKFDAISRLRNHIVKHTKEKNFGCDICGGRFVTQAALVYHKRLHTGEKPFPCDLCNESFLSASRRMEHRRRKHFKPTKECHVCHSKFVMGSQLKQHVKRHSNPQSKLYLPKPCDSQKYVIETVLE